MTEKPTGINITPTKGSHLPAEDVQVLKVAAEKIAALPTTSTLRSGESTLPIVGTPANREVAALGLQVEVNKDAPKIEKADIANAANQVTQGASD